MRVLLLVAICVVFLGALAWLVRSSWHDVDKLEELKYPLLLAGIVVAAAISLGVPSRLAPRIDALKLGKQGAIDLAIRDEIVRILSPGGAHAELERRPYMSIDRQIPEDPRQQRLTEGLIGIFQRSGWEAGDANPTFAKPALEGIEFIQYPGPEELRAQFEARAELVKRGIEMLGQRCSTRLSNDTRESDMIGIIIIGPFKPVSDPKCK